MYTYMCNSVTYMSRSTLLFVVSSPYYPTRLFFCLLQVLPLRYTKMIISLESPILVIPYKSSFIIRSSIDSQVVMSSPKPLWVMLTTPYLALLSSGTTLLKILHEPRFSDLLAWSVFLYSILSEILRWFFSKYIFFTESGSGLPLPTSSISRAWDRQWGV